MAQKEVKTVKVLINDVEYDLPEGMNLVDAAKLTGEDIPVFCYHPKLGHDGNCRMCLVELGAPRPNRETGEMELAWFPTLQTACTQTVRDGMAIRTTTPKVIDGRREILEFLLSSHPLDCPICDKGGECPLQNLTMRHGPGTSRMYWTDKMRLGKHVPLGELIYLDQERCIHCARCIRFQDKIAADPVLGFDERGRRQQIITYSQPGFDSTFSGNTTDICPVGALTTADFRFNARPWEMVQVASLDTHFPSGDNISFDTRTDREAGGRTTVKRVMPRQNEQVNEIWISDKTRFVRHYMEHPDRLQRPLVRKGGQLVEVGWDEALDEVASQLQGAGSAVAAIAGPRLSNEDYYTIQQLIRSLGSSHLAAYPSHLSGAEIAAEVGIAQGSNLAELGAGDAILVIASDLHAEAPIWWLRLKAAAERGAQLIVANGRPTRLDEWASESIRYAYGQEAITLGLLLAELKVDGTLQGLGEALAHVKGRGADDAVKRAAEALTGADNLVIFVGAEGLTSSTSQGVTQAAANLLLATGHFGHPHNGLVMVWPGANLQGAADMGFSHRFGPGYQPLEVPELDYEGILRALEDNTIKAVLVAGADTVFDDPRAEKALRETKATVIVHDMFLTDTANLADVVLPVQSVAEREGTFTSGERRVQRFFPAVESIGESKADWEIASLLRQRLGGEKPRLAASLVFMEIARTLPQYAGMSYQTLTHYVEQFPNVGGEDLYYGGTTYTNRNGIGQQWPVASEEPGFVAALRSVAVAENPAPQAGEWLVVPVASLYDRESLCEKTTLIQERVPAPHIRLHPDDAQVQGIVEGSLLGVPVGDGLAQVTAVLDATTPRGVAIIPRRLQRQGAPVGPVAATLQVAEKA